MRSVALPPDDELLPRLLARDERTFEALVDAWSSGMVRVALLYVSTHDSAYEVVQDAWLAMLRELPAFQRRSSLRTWVYRILINTAKRRGAREHRVVPLSSLGSAAELEDAATVDPDRFQGAAEPFPGHWREFPAPWTQPEDAAIAAELRSHLLSAVEQLPERQRLVLVLRDIEGFPGDEVSVALQLSAGNQRVLLHRARAFVRGRLEEYYGSVEAVRGSSGVG